MKNYKMNTWELQVTLSFCFIFLLRMLGMFMVLPIITKYGMLLNGSNKFLIGLSIGIYGFAQVIFQIPFGVLSDKYDRKKIIILGLFLFFIGSILSGSTNSIWGLIIGRFLQGSGAISGVSMAFLSDLIREEHRVKSIASIGLSFAISFVIAIISSPIIVQYFGFFSLFWISSFFSIISIFIVFFVFPSSSSSVLKSNLYNTYKNIFMLFHNKDFLRYYIGIFFLHCLLMINFIIIPNQFELLGFFVNDHWKAYSSTIVVSFFVLFFFIFYCKMKCILDNIIELSIVFLLFSGIVFLIFHNYLICLICSLQIFFIAFNFLETFLPTYLSKKVTENYKGSVMSIYSTSQFLGIFFGGIIGGLLSSYFIFTHIFLFEICLIILWLICSIIIKNKFES